MTPRQKRQAALAVLCAIGSLSASVSGLVEVATRVHAPGLDLPGGYTFPIATIGLVLSLDGLHLASAYAAHARNRSKPTVLLLLATTALSAGLQAWAAKAPPAEPELIGLARVVALLPAVMTLGALWLAIKSMDTDDPAPATAPRKAPSKPKVTRPAPPAPDPVAPEVAPGQVTRVTPEAPSAPAASEAGEGDLEAVARTVGADLEVTRKSDDALLVDLVTRVASESGVNLPDLGRPRVRQICAAAGCGVGADRATRILGRARGIHAVPPIEAETGT